MATIALTIPLGSRESKQDMEKPSEEIDDRTRELMRQCSIKAHGEYANISPIDCVTYGVHKWEALMEYLQ